MYFAKPHANRNFEIGNFCNDRRTTRIASPGGALCRCLTRAPAKYHRSSAWCLRARGISHVYLINDRIPLLKSGREVEPGCRARVRFSSLYERQLRFAYTRRAFPAVATHTPGGTLSLAHPLNNNTLTAPYPVRQTQDDASRFEYIYESTSEIAVRGRGLFPSRIIPKPRLQQ